jgi:hypothetical protein
LCRGVCLRPNGAHPCACQGSQSNGFHKLTAIDHGTHPVSRAVLLFAACRMQPSQLMPREQAKVASVFVAVK